MIKQVLDVKKRWLLAFKVMGAAAFLLVAGSSLAATPVALLGMGISNNHLNLKFHHEKGELIEEQEWEFPSIEAYAGVVFPSYLGVNSQLSLGMGTWDYDWAEEMHAASISFNLHYFVPLFSSNFTTKFEMGYYFESFSPLPHDNPNVDSHYKSLSWSNNGYRLAASLGYLNQLDDLWLLTFSIQDPASTAEFFVEQFEIRGVEAIRYKLSLSYLITI